MQNTLSRRYDELAEVAPSVETDAASSRRTATRADLLDALALTCPGLERTQARDVFEMALEEVSNALTRGESVKLRSFGLFSVRAKRERVGRNPRTGVEVPIKPRRVLTFRPSPVLLDQVNGREGTCGKRRGTLTDALDGRGASRLDQ